MKQEEKLQLQFERYNSKYNRIWSQLTDIYILTLTIAIPYLIYVLNKPSTLEHAKIYIKVNWVYGGIFLIVAVVSAILGTQLLSSGIKVHKTYNRLQEI